MKIVILVTSLAAAIIAGLFCSNSRSGQAMNVKLRAKGIPEHGLSIVTSTDPYFNTLIADFLQGKPDALGEVLKPFSIFVRNTSNRMVVAYMIKWEFTAPDGRVVPSTDAVASTWIFMRGAVTNLDTAIANDGTIIKPNSARFFSLAAVPDALPRQNGVGVESFSFAFKDRNNSEKFQRAQQEHDPIAQVEILNTELSLYTDITVSIDGAFFEDGSFVGPNTTDFFGQIQAQLDARQDIVREVEHGLEQGKSVGEILRPYEELVKEPIRHPGQDATLMDHYNSFKQMFAGEPLAVKMSLRDDEARRQALCDYVKKRITGWVTLKKL